MSRLVLWFVVVIAFGSFAHGQPTVAPAPTPKVVPPDDASKPRLVAKGEAYFIHIVPEIAATKVQPARPMMVTHTSRTTGELSVLVSGGRLASCFEPVSDLVPESRETDGIAGVRADGERLYILMMHRSVATSPQLGLVQDLLTSELHAFWLVDGSSIGKWSVQIPKTYRPDSAEAGPLRAVLDGVSVFGQRFNFAGKQFVNRTTDAPTDVPAPVVLAATENYRILGIAPFASGSFTVVAKGSSGASIIYLPLHGGKPKTLLQTGNREFLAPGESEQFSATQSRVVGAVADAERLYVVVWNSRWDLKGAGREFVEDMFGHAPPRRPALPREPMLLANDDYKLHVFWLADARDLQPVQLPAKGGKVIPEEILTHGPLEVVSGGVKVFGETITYKGKDRVK
jgi:hypothetical protein